jgi:hypothetical protein
LSGLTSLCEDIGNSLARCVGGNSGFRSGMKYIGLAVDKGIRVLELELGRDVDRYGDDLFDMFLCVIVWCGVVSRHDTIPFKW